MSIKIVLKITETVNKTEAPTYTSKKLHSDYFDFILVYCFLLQLVGGNIVCL